MNTFDPYNEFLNVAEYPNWSYDDLYRILNDIFYNKHE